MVQNSDLPIPAELLPLVVVDTPQVPGKQSTIVGVTLGAWI